MTETRESLIAALTPPCRGGRRRSTSPIRRRTARGLDERFPFAGLSELKDRLRKAARVRSPRGTRRLAREAGRSAKPGPATFELSIDAVVMAWPGAGHRHPNGECSLAFALEGRPTFDWSPRRLGSRGAGFVARADGRGRQDADHLLPSRRRDRLRGDRACLTKIPPRRPCGSRSGIRIVGRSPQTSVDKEIGAFVVTGFAIGRTSHTDKGSRWWRLVAAGGTPRPPRNSSGRIPSRRRSACPVQLGSFHDI
jgi:hypothetical protein